MSDTRTTPKPATVVKRHPVRGFLWGLIFGLGLTIVLVVTKVINLDLTMVIIVWAIGTLVGILWSMFAPAKAPKGPPPAVPGDQVGPEVSRFDDFTDPVDASDESPYAGDDSGGDSGDSVD